MGCGGNLAGDGRKGAARRGRGGRVDELEKVREGRMDGVDGRSE